MKHTAYIIETEGLTKRFGSRSAVTGVNLAVPRGGAFGFLGHNGAGKTTVIRLLLGLIHPDAGTVRISGRSISAQRQHALARVGAIIEEPRFHAHLTGRENLQVVAAVRGAHAAARIEPALERVGLASRAGDRVRTYSQGMRQRLGIARCLLADPELVILDEPLNGLDPAGILAMRALIAGMVAEGKTVFLSSHLLDEIEKTCHAVAIIDQGRLVAQGPIADLAGSDRDQFAIGCDNPAAALALLAHHPAVNRVWESAGRVHVALTDPAAIGAINARLIAAGLAVSSLAPVRPSLEDRFLQLTSRRRDSR